MPLQFKTGQKILLLKDNNSIMLECCCAVCECCCRAGTAKEFQTEMLTIDILHVSGTEATSEFTNCLIQSGYFLPFSHVETDEETNEPYCVFKNTFSVGEFQNSMVVTMEAKIRNGDTSCMNLNIVVAPCSVNDCSNSPWIRKPGNYVNGEWTDTLVSQQADCKLSEEQDEYPVLDGGSCGCDPSCWDKHSYGGTVIVKNARFQTTPTEDSIPASTWETIINCLNKSITVSPDPDNPCEWGMDEEARVTLINDGAEENCSQSSVAFLESYGACVGLPEGFVLNTTDPVAALCLNDDIDNIERYAKDEIVLSITHAATGARYNILADVGWHPDRYDSCKHQVYKKITDLECPEDDKYPCGCDVQDCGDLIADSLARKTFAVPFPSGHNYGVVSELNQQACEAVRDFQNRQPKKNEQDLCDVITENQEHGILCGCKRVVLRTPFNFPAKDFAPNGARIPVKYRIFEQERWAFYVKEGMDLNAEPPMPGRWWLENEFTNANICACDDDGCVIAEKILEYLDYLGPVVDPDKYYFLFDPDNGVLVDDEEVLDNPELYEYRFSVDVFARNTEADQDECCRCYESQMDDAYGPGTDMDQLIENCRGENMWCRPCECTETIFNATSEFDSQAQTRVGFGTPECCFASSRSQLNFDFGWGWTRGSYLQHFRSAYHEENPGEGATCDNMTYGIPQTWGARRMIAKNMTYWRRGAAYIDFIGRMEFYAWNPGYCEYSDASGFFGSSAGIGLGGHCPPPDPAAAYFVGARENAVVRWSFLNGRWEYMGTSEGLSNTDALYSGAPITIAAGEVKSLQGIFTGQDIFYGYTPSNTLPDCETRKFAGHADKCYGETVGNQTAGEVWIDDWANRMRTKGQVGCNGDFKGCDGELLVDFQQRCAEYSINVIQNGVCPPRACFPLKDPGNLAKQGQGCCVRLDIYGWAYSLRAEVSDSTSTGLYMLKQFGANRLPAASVRFQFRVDGCDERFEMPLFAADNNPAFYDASRAWACASKYSTTPEQRCTGSTNNLLYFTDSAFFDDSEAHSPEMPHCGEANPGLDHYIWVVFGNRRKGDLSGSTTITELNLSSKFCCCGNSIDKSEMCIELVNWTVCWDFPDDFPLPMRQAVEAINWDLTWYSILGEASVRESFDEDDCDVCHQQALENVPCAPEGCKVNCECSEDYDPLENL